MLHTCNMNSLKMLQCPRCGYETRTKGNMQKHVLRKKQCLPTLEDLTVQEIYDKRPDWLVDDKPKPYVCTLCQASFTTSQGRSRHIHHYCKGGKAKPAEGNNYQELTHQLKVLTDRIATIESSSSSSGSGSGSAQIHQDHCNNIQVVNIVNAFGNEDTSHLTCQFLDRCVRKTNAGLVDLLDKLHFGAQDGRNANIRITNRKLPLAEVNDGKHWRFVKRDRIIHQMVDRGQDILQEHLDEHQERIREQLSESMWEHIQHFFEHMEVKDERTLRDILDDVYIMLLNKTRDMTSLA
jgi:hypothetical protein